MWRALFSVIFFGVGFGLFAAAWGCSAGADFGDLDGSADGGGTGPTDTGPKDTNTGLPESFCGPDTGLPPDVGGSDAHPSDGGGGGPLTIGGKVSGLAGMGLVLQDNDGDYLTITADGPFTFVTPLSSGTKYTVLVMTPPTMPTQTCTVTKGTGTVKSANVTTVDVACTTSTFTVGGMVTGLSTGDSVVIEDNLTDDLTVATNGAFTFATSIASGAMYSVTVKTQPASPAETCYVSGATGTVAAANVTNVVVSCFVPGVECGRFTTGYTGAWSTVAVNPFTAEMGLSGYLPAGGTVSIYLNYLTSLDSYSGGTDTYTTLAPAPTEVPAYGSTTWLEDSLWSVSEGDVLQYDISTNTWTTVTTGLTTGNDIQTTSDDVGNLWSYSAEGTLLQYNVAAGTTTYHTLTTALTGFEPRITYDSCTGLLYLADYTALPFYSYDPVSGTQVTLTSLPASNEFQDGFCGDRSGHIFAVTNTSTMYQYTISTGVWAAMPTGGPTGLDNSACGVGADGYLYATDPEESSAMYRIQLN
jgi:hypothetical protein